MTEKIPDFANMDEWETECPKETCTNNLIGIIVYLEVTYGYCTTCKGWYDDKGNFFESPFDLDKVREENADCN